MFTNLTTKRLLAAWGLAAGAAGAAAAPATIDLSTGAGWKIGYNDIEAQVSRVGPAFTYDCLGNAAGPQCLSVTSTGYADGTWLPGAGPLGFPGDWRAYVDFTLPSGAANVLLLYQLLGVDDHVQAVISKNGNGVFLAEADVGGGMPGGGVYFDDSPILSGPGSAYRLTLEVVNNPFFRADPRPLPIGGGDGTAVVGRFSVQFDQPGDPNPVPEPGTLACAGLALATALGVRRRSPRRDWR